MDERRKHARFKSSTILQYKDGIFTAQTDAVTKDVSLGGVCFFSDRKIKLGKIIKIRLFYDPKAPAKIVNGKVVWSRPYDDKITKGFLNGLTFVR